MDILLFHVHFSIFLPSIAQSTSLLVSPVQTDSDELAIRGPADVGQLRTFSCELLRVL